MIHCSPGRLNRVYFQLIVLAGAAVLLSGLAGDAVLVLSAIFLLGLLKTKLIVLDFLGMRERSTPMRMALLAWPALFAFAAIATAVLVDARIGG
ncbi:cytochrome C oxidase subunit IV family protein [Rhizobium sp. A37_96]